MKKFLSLLLLCSFVLLSLTACMSDEEKQQARENEQLAKPVIERYLEQNYSGAIIKDIECLKTTGGAIFPETYATDFVRAKVLYKLKTFNVLIDLQTKQFYNDYYNQKIINELKKLLFGSLSVEKPEKLELEFVNRNVLTNIDGGWGYLKADIDSAEELLASDEHKVYVVCKYADSDMNFKAIPVKKFFKNEYKSEINLFFINYRNAQRYDGADEIVGAYYPTSFLNNPEEYYNIEDLKSATLHYADNSFDDVDESIDVQEYEEDYVHNKSEIYNGVEFVWNDELYDIDFSMTKAEPVVSTKYYNGEPFYAKKSNAIKLDCTKITHDYTDSSDRVYMFFDDSLSGEYLITENNGSVEVNDLLWAGYDTCVYQYERLGDDSHEITVGIYERRKNNNQSE